MKHINTSETADEFFQMRTQLSLLRHEVSVLPQAVSFCPFTVHLSLTPGGIYSSKNSQGRNFNPGLKVCGTLDEGPCNQT